MRATKIFCFGHRGARGYEPENTLCSVRKALELGADGVEVDVYLVDGRLIVIHDDTLDRTTNGSGPVSGQTFASLRSLDAGHGERIPTLEEVFDVVNRRGVVNVELKGPGTAVPVARLIEQYLKRPGWSVEDFLVSSFDRGQIRQAIELLPEIRTGLLIDKVPRGLIEMAKELGVWSIHPSKRCVTRKLVDDAHQSGMKVLVYTVNQPREIASVARLGVDGVFTDFPDRVFEFERSQSQIRKHSSKR